MKTKKETEKLNEFDKHQDIIYLNNPKTGLKGFIAFHKKLKVLPSFGATRFWKYKSETEAIKDALRLSKLMSYKSALAGLKYGGAKATIIRNDKFPKEKVLETYAKELNKLKGKFITGTDVGLNLDDLNKMKKVSKYLVGLKSNPEKYTAVGLFFAIQVICKKLFGSESLKNRSFAIQGVGKVGYEFLKIVYKNANKIYISDTNNERIKFIQKLFPKVIATKPNQIQKQVVDIYMPCALSHALNKQTIKQLHCKIIAGSANNQLENKTIADELYNKNIFYAPDYVVNAGGLISVVDEYENKNFNPKRIEQKVKKIKTTLEKIMKKTYSEKVSPARIADKMAEEIIANMK